MTASPTNQPTTSDSTLAQRKLVVGTNLKMHQTPDETAAMISALADLTRTMSNRAPSLQLYVCPPYTSLHGAVEATRAADIPLWIGAQNVHHEAQGAYTGEISTGMLTAIGADLVLLGHAERRQLFHESDAALAAKVPAAINAGLNVMLCVGETADERAWGVSDETVARQLQIATSALSVDDLDRLIVAYEPVWAIGAPEPATSDDVAPIIAVLRESLGDRFGTAGICVPILYGGSVNAESAGTMLRDLPDLDGYLVGRIGLTVEGYTSVVESAVAARFGDS